MKVIGLTGGIGTGKSTVARLFKDKGIPVIDLDQLVRDLQKPGKDVYRQIVEVFGKEILQKDGTLNRKELGRIVFKDSQKREKLNRIVHPAVLNKLRELIFRYQASQEKFVVVEVPLLYELKLDNIFDSVILVYAPKDIQIKRIMERDNLTLEEAIDRINSQLSIEEKKKLADIIIDNSGSFENTKKQFDSIFNQLISNGVKV